jgi:signal transduction histidine kinase
MQQRREQVANELKLERRERDKLEGLKHVYVSVAAHELRSPMASMMAYLELLAEGDYGDLTDDQRAAIEVLANSARRLIDTTDQLLDVTRLAEDRVDLLLQPAILEEVVRQTINEHAPRAAASGIDLQSAIPKAIPLILCDEVRVAQILANLVGNAIKYTPEGGHVVVRADAQDDQGMVRIRVEDDGVGISEADQARLFERFFRAESAQLTGAPGTGLGLHISRALVELHSGEIGVESTPGIGSTFWFTLPTVTLDGR